MANFEEALRSEYFSSSDKIFDSKLNKPVDNFEDSNIPSTAKFVRYLVTTVKKRHTIRANLCNLRFN